MPRSEASLARRAHKRGRSIEEQRKVDKEKDRGYKGKSWDSTLTNRKRKQATAATPSEPGNKDTPEGDTNNKRPKTTDGSLQATSTTTTSSTTATVSSSSSSSSSSTSSTSSKPKEEDQEEDREMWTCTKCMTSTNWITRYKCRECQSPRYDKKARKESNKKWIDPKVANNWKAPATEDTLQQNAKLRAAYEQCPEAMTEDDRNRAKTLIERTARKKKKKMERRKAHEAKQASKAGVK